MRLGVEFWFPSPHPRPPPHFSFVPHPSSCVDEARVCVCQHLYFFVCAGDERQELYTLWYIFVDDGITPVCLFVQSRFFNRALPPFPCFPSPSLPLPPFVLFLSFFLGLIHPLFVHFLFHFFMYFLLPLSIPPHVNCSVLCFDALLKNVFGKNNNNKNNNNDISLF